MDSFYLVVDVFVAICGVYVIAQYVFMVRTQELRQNMMIPKNFDVKKCRDVKGYINAIGKKQLAFGIAAVICGLISLAQDVFGVYNMYVSMTAMVVFIILCIWYGRESKKAMDQFWK